MILFLFKIHSANDPLLCPTGTWISSVPFTSRRPATDISVAMTSPGNSRGISSSEQINREQMESDEWISDSYFKNEYSAIRRLRRVFLRAFNGSSVSLRKFGCWARCRAVAGWVLNSDQLLCTVMLGTEYCYCLRGITGCKKLSCNGCWCNSWLQKIVMRRSLM